MQATSTDYHILDNGGMPFLVKVDGPHVRVYRTPRRLRLDPAARDRFLEEFFDPAVPARYTELVAEFAAKRVLPGATPPAPEWTDQQEWLEKCGWCGDASRGNTVLIELDGAEHSYVCIAREIFSFATEGPVLGFFSPIGNSDCPCPYAVTKEHTYLLLPPSCHWRISNREHDVRERDVRERDVDACARVDAQTSDDGVGDELLAWWRNADDDVQGDPFWPNDDEHVGTPFAFEVLVRSPYD